MSQKAATQKRQNEQEEDETPNNNKQTNLVSKQKSSVWHMFKGDGEVKGSYLCLCCEALGKNVKVKQTTEGTGNLQKHFKATSSKKNFSGKSAETLTNPECDSLYTRLQSQLAHNKTCKKDEAVDIDDWLKNQLDSIRQHVHVAKKKVRMGRRKEKEKEKEKETKKERKKE